MYVYIYLKSSERAKLNKKIRIVIKFNKNL